MGSAADRDRRLQEVKRTLASIQGLPRDEAERVLAWARGELDQLDAELDVERIRLQAKGKWVCAFMALVVLWLAFCVGASIGAHRWGLVAFNAALWCATAWRLYDVSRFVWWNH